MISLTMVPKDPDDIVEYTVELDGMGGDAISAVTCVATGGLTVLSGGQAPTFTASSFTFWVSGGSANTEPTVRATVTTTGGRTIARTIAIPVRGL